VLATRETYKVAACEQAGKSTAVSFRLAARLEERTHLRKVFGQRRTLMHADTVGVRSLKILLD